MPSHVEERARPVIVLLPGDYLFALPRTQPFLVGTIHMNHPLNELKKKKRNKDKFQKNSVN